MKFMKLFWSFEVLILCNPRSLSVDSIYEKKFSERRWCNRFVEEKENEYKGVESIVAEN